MSNPPRTEQPTQIEYGSQTLEARKWAWDLKKGRRDIPANHPIDAPCKK